MISLLRKRSVVTLFSMIFVVTALPNAQAIDWPQFHGAAGDNISTEVGLLRQWPDGGPKLVWTTKGMGDGFASVSVADGLLYTAGNIGNETVATALDLDGQVVWQKACGAAWTKNHRGARGTPAVDDGRLYFETPFGDVGCISATVISCSLTMSGSKTEESM